MAANSEGTIITTRGLQLITKLAGARGQIEFTNVKVGTGRLPIGTDPAELTHLITYKMDGMIAGYGYDEEAKDAYVVMQIVNEGIESGFIMTEVGLYAKDPDLGEILYAYVDLSNDPNHIMPAENGRSKTVQIKLHVIVGEVTELHAVINPLSQVTREEFDRELNTKVTASGGDITDTVIAGFTDSTAQYPVPAPGDTAKVGFGKIKKFFEDIRNTATGACFIGQIVNNCVTDRADLPLSAAQGKGLMELCTKLNSDIAMINSNLGEHLIALPDSATAMQSKNGDVLRRLQIQTANDNVVYLKSTDSGQTWPIIKVLLTDADIAPLNSQYVGNINDNIPGKVNITLWDTNTADTPFKTGQTTYGNGFCITLNTGTMTGDDYWLCQLLMAVGDSHLFTRHRRAGVWSGWTVIGSPTI